jgi:hypothetical protein
MIKRKYSGARFVKGLISESHDHRVVEMDMMSKRERKRENGQLSI